MITFTKNWLYDQLIVWIHDTFINAFMNKPWTVRSIVKYLLHPITNTYHTMNRPKYHTPHYAWSIFTSNTYLPLYTNTKTELLNHPITKFNNIPNSYLFYNLSHFQYFSHPGTNTIIGIKQNIYIQTKIPQLINKNLTHTASSRTSEQDSRRKIQIAKTLKIMVSQPTFQKHTLHQTPLPPILPPIPSNITNKILYPINKICKKSNTTKPSAININTEQEQNLKTSKINLYS